MDFQVGDEVFCLLNGEGVVVEFIKGSLYRPVVVKFAGGRFEQYSLGGHFAISNKNPCLYHKGTVVTIKPVQPKRYKWANIYSDIHGNCVLGCTYESEANALVNVECRASGDKYVDTIQLKPKGEK